MISNRFDHAVLSIIYNCGLLVLVGPSVTLAFQLLSHEYRIYMLTFLLRKKKEKCLPLIGQSLNVKSKSSLYYSAPYKFLMLLTLVYTDLLLPFVYITNFRKQGITHIRCIPLVSQL